jgi:hypothetical protein
MNASRPTERCDTAKEAATLSSCTKALDCVGTQVLPALHDVIIVMRRRKAGAHICEEHFVTTRFMIMPFEAILTMAPYLTTTLRFSAPQKTCNSTTGNCLTSVAGSACGGVCLSGTCTTFSNQAICFDNFCDNTQATCVCTGGASGQFCEVGGPPGMLPAALLFHCLRTIYCCSSIAATLYGTCVSFCHIVIIWAWIAPDRSRLHCRYLGMFGDTKFDSIQ